MVFYFTGTGNSLYIAKELDEKRQSIPQIMNSESFEFSAEKIGIVCPIYAHEMPKMVKQFLQKAVFHCDYLYVVLTYGARHGNAVELADQYLMSVGKNANYISTLLMVDNFLPVFDMNEEMQADKKIGEQLSKIKADIRQRKPYKQPVTSQDRAIHKMYLESVKNAQQTVWADFTVTDECVGCGICMKVCPSGSISLIKQKAVHIGDDCQACFACIHACPKPAIRLNTSEKNKSARYRNPNISLSEIVAANYQTKN